MGTQFKSLLDDVRGCTLCAEQLSHGVRPVVQANPTAIILIAGQAPGTRVHETGVPFNDPSGERLREWMGIDSTIFYDPDLVALLPMAFCYPGKGRSGDLPPPAICAKTWRKRLLAGLPHIQLTLAIGQYAQQWHLPERKRTLTETVRAWADYGDGLLPLPHPSPRNNIWLKKNPWFEVEVLPHLRTRIQRLLG